MKKIKFLDCAQSLESVSIKFGQSLEWIIPSLKGYDCEFNWVKIYSG